MPDRDWTIIIVLGVGWGMTFYFNELLLRDLGPVSVSLSRVAIAAIFCWLYLLATRKNAAISVSALAPLFVLGAAMFAVPFAIYPIGQQYIASGVAGIVNALTPLMVVIVSHFWPGGERATRLKSLGVLAGFLGIVLLTVPAMQSDQEGQLWGTLFIVLAPVSYAFAMNWVRSIHDISVPVMVTWALTGGALLLVPVVAVTEGVPEGLQASSWASLLFLGVVLTGISFLVAFQVLPRAGATKMSTVTFIAPVSALLIGRFALDEELGLAHFLGMAAIFVGLLLIDGRLFRARAQPKAKPIG